MTLLKLKDFFPDMDVNDGIEVINQLQFETQSATPTDDDLAEGRVYVDSDTHKIYCYLNSSWVDLGTSGGGTGTADLDGVYSLGGNTVTLDEGPITFVDASAGAANSFVLVKSGAGSGNIIDISISTTFTGNAIDIDLGAGIGAKAIYLDGGGGTRTADIFDIKFDGDGNANAINVTSTNTGSGSVINIGMGGANTGEVINIDMDLAIAAKAIYLDCGNKTRTADLIDVKFDGDGNVDVFNVTATNTGSGSIFDIGMAGTGSGEVFNIDMDLAVGMKAFYIDSGAGIRTADLIDIKHDGSGNADVLNITSTNTGTGAIFDIYMDADGSDAGVFNVDMNLAVTASWLVLDAGGEARTANLFEITHDGSGNVDVFAITDSNTGSGSVFDIDMSGATATGAVMDVDMGAAVARPFLTLDYGDGTRTEDVFQIKFDGNGAAPFWDIDITHDTESAANYWDINVTGTYAASILSVTYGASATGDCVVLDMTSAVGASAIAITGAGARTDDLIKIDDASTGAGTRSIFDINITGAGTFPVLDINLGNSAANATAILITEGTATSSVPLINIDSAGTGATHTIDVDYTGVFTGNCLDITYGTAAATGNAIDLNMSANVAGMAISIASSATGISGEGAGLDIAHNGNLAAGADLVRIVSTGDASSTTNLLFIESSGSNVAGSFALNINAGDDMEAIKVDAGTVVFDESLTIGTTLAVTGASTFTAAVSCVAGVQFGDVARTGRDDGGATSVIAAGTSWVTVTAADLNKYMVLPEPVLGNIVWFQEDSGQNGYEIRCADPANQYLNNVTGSGVELAVAADTVVQCICNEDGATGGWICVKYSNVGAPAGAGTAGA